MWMRSQTRQPGWTDFAWSEPFPRLDGRDYCMGGSGLLGFKTVSRWKLSVELKLRFSPKLRQFSLSLGFKYPRLCAALYTALFMSLALAPCSLVHTLKDAECSNAQVGRSHWRSWLSRKYEGLRNMRRGRWEVDKVLVRAQKIHVGFFRKPQLIHRLNWIMNYMYTFSYASLTHHHSSGHPTLSAIES